jgi:hypothetical protein
VSAGRSAAADGIKMTEASLLVLNLSAAGRYCSPERQRPRQRVGSRPERGSWHIPALRQGERGCSAKAMHWRIAKREGLDTECYVPDLGGGGLCVGVGRVRGEPCR